MSTPNIAQREPFVVSVEAGRDYWWCACGLSKSQPFCDGSHKTTAFTPVKFTAVKTGQTYFCGCKHTNRQPLCDGTHKGLP